MRNHNTLQGVEGLPAPWPTRWRRRALWARLGLGWRAETSRPAPAPGANDRIYAVGDIHGRADLFARLLDRMARDATGQTDTRQPHLVLLGDCIDRGDGSNRVLDLIAQAERTWPHVIYLRGNHEDALLRFLNDPVRGRGWLGWGGLQTLAAFGVPAPGSTADRDRLKATSDALRDALGDHLRRLRATQSSFRSGDVICAHAGIDPRVAPDRQRDGALVWGQSPFLKRTGPSNLRVVYGHFTHGEAMMTRTRIGLDTGAYHTGRLSAVRLDQGTRLFQT